MKSNRWWLKKTGPQFWQLKYADYTKIFETFRCGITAVEIRAMLNRNRIIPPLPHYR